MNLKEQRATRVHGRTYDTYNPSSSTKHGMNYKLLIIQICNVSLHKISAAVEFDT
jgi:hypothetical protein